MKIPKTFLPEKSMDKKCESLMSVAPKGLEHLVLDEPELGSITSRHKITDFTFIKFLDKKDMVGSAFVSYNSGEALIHIIEFESLEMLNSNKGNIARCVDDVNAGNVLLRASALTKYEHAVLIYTTNHQRRACFTDAYKEMGFEEVKV